MCSFLLNEKLFDEVEVDEVNDNADKGFYDSYDYVLCVMFSMQNKRDFDIKFDCVYDALDEDKNILKLQYATDRIFGSTIGIDDYSCAIISPYSQASCIASERYLDEAISNNGYAVLDDEMDKNRMFYSHNALMNVGFNGYFEDVKDAYKFFMSINTIYSELFEGLNIMFKIIKAERNNPHAIWTKSMFLDRYNEDLYNYIRLLLPENEQIFPQMMRIFTKNDYSLVISIMNRCAFWSFEEPLSLLQYKGTRVYFGYHQFDESVLDSIMMCNSVGCAEFDVRKFMAYETIDNALTIRKRLMRIIRTYRHPIYFTFFYNVPVRDSLAIGYLFPNTLFDDGEEVLFIAATSVSDVASPEDIAILAKPYSNGASDDELKRFVRYLLQSVKFKDSLFEEEVYEKMKELE